MATKCPACGHEFTQPTPPQVINSAVLAVCRSAIDDDPDDLTANAILDILQPKRERKPSGCSGCRGL